MDREVLRAAVMQTGATYIGLRQGVVAQWVSLRPIFELYYGSQGYRGRGRGKPWLRQEALYEVLWDALS